MKVDGLLKEIIKEETKVVLEFNHLEMIVFVMNPLMSRHKLAIKKAHIMRRLGHAIQESPQPKPWTPPNQVNLQRTGNKNGSGQVRGMEGVQDMDKAEDPEGHQHQEQADPELSIAEVQPRCWLCQDDQAQVRVPARSARHVAREDIAARTAGSCILTKHPNGSRTNSNPRKFGRAAKRGPMRKEVAKEKDHIKVGRFCLAKAVGARYRCRRVVRRSIRSCSRKPRPRCGSVSDTIEKVPGNAGIPRGLTRLVGIWAPHQRLYAPLCG